MLLAMNVHSHAAIDDLNGRDVPPAFRDNQDAEGVDLVCRVGFGTPVIARSGIMPEIDMVHPIGEQDGRGLDLHAP